MRSIALDDHPTVQLLRDTIDPQPLPPLTAEEFRTLALAAGADDAAAVSLDHPALVDEKPHVLGAMPEARSLLCVVLRTHADNIRTPKRSVANLEFHRAGHEVDEIAQRIAVELSRLGYPTINPAMAFPMEMEHFPERSWIVAHKKVAVAAQLGRMGIHRSVIHPKFGSFILLGTVITSAELVGSPRSLDFNPCVSCKLCVAACPVGAIEPDGGFRFSACYDHNYREFMTGFGDFAEAIAESKDRHALRERFSISETASMWQSLAYGPNYKTAYCIAVCPAGEDVMAPFLKHRSNYLQRVVRPLTERVETVYAVAGSDAAAHVTKRFPHKKLRTVQSSLRPTGARAFFRAMPLSFQRGPARGWKATFYFDLSGDEAITATVCIDNGTLTVSNGLVGTPDITIKTDGALWIDIVTGKRNPVLAVLTRKLKIDGDRALLKKFAACFAR